MNLLPTLDRPHLARWPAFPVWTSEAKLWRTPDKSPRFAARPIVGSGEAELNIAPAAPLLSSAPWYIGDEQAQDFFPKLLTDPARRMPVIVVSLMNSTNPERTIGMDKLAAGLCGLADVVAILPETSGRSPGGLANVCPCSIAPFDI